MFIYEKLLYKQFNALKWFKMCDCILLISKQPFMLHTSKNANDLKTHCVKATPS